MIRKCDRRRRITKAEFRLLGVADLRTGTGVVPTYEACCRGIDRRTDARRLPRIRKETVCVNAVGRRSERVYQVCSRQRCARSTPRITSGRGCRDIKPIAALVTHYASHEPPPRSRSVELLPGVNLDAASSLQSWTGRPVRCFRGPAGSRTRAPEKLEPFDSDSGGF